MAKSSFFNSDTPSDPTTNTSFYQGGEQEAEQVEGSFFENNNGDYVPVATLEGLAEQIEEDLGAATEQANAAAASATAAAGSASSAATSASNASASASAAAGSASAAHASETAAAASAAAAAASASNASSSASAASTSASNASTSASQASTSETNAAASAGSAASSAAAAAASAASVDPFVPETSVIFVSKTGSDADPGTYRPSPKLTLASAITAAAALVSGGAPKAVVRVLDAGSYTENIALAANVVLDAKDATLVGTLTLDVGSSAFLHRHYSNGSGQRVVEAITTSGEVSHYQVNILDGRGLAGTDINNQCIRNGTAGRVIMATAGQVFVPQGGEGVRDGTAGGGFGHVHFFIRDLYLAGNNAKGLTTNNATTWLVGYVEHILKVGSPTGTVGINLNDAGSTISLTSVEVNADTAYNIAAGSLYLNCPKVTGTQTGTPVVDTSYFSNGTRGDITVSGGGATWTIGNTKVTYAKIQNVSAQYRILGRTSTGAGVIEEISTLPAQVMPAFTGGDVTSSAGSLALTIGNTKVTYAKIQNVSATNKLLGRATAGAGSVEEITCTPFARTVLDDTDAATARSTLGAQASLGYTPLNAASNLSDVANASTARTNLGLGSAATLNVGTSANNVVQLDGSAKLPAVDGSQLTGISAGSAEPQGCCYLSKSSTNLLLSRRNGRSLWINGANESIPSGGVTLSTSGLSASTFYYIYAYMNAGTMTLEASTTAPTADTTYGHQIKTGDGTRSLVGAAYTDTGPAWADANGKLWVLSYFNRLRKGSRTNFTTNRTTTSTSGTEINSEIRCNFIAWGDTPTKVWQNTVALNSAGGNSVQGGNAVDSTSVYKDSCQSTVAVANGAACFAATSLVSGLTENATHYATVLGHVNAGTGTWISAQTALYVEVLG